MLAEPRNAFKNVLKIKGKIKKCSVVRPRKEVILPEPLTTGTNNN